MPLPPRLKSTLRPFGVAGRAIGPTGIGVLLSVGAHAVFIAASAQGRIGGGGGGGGLFQAFDEAANEERIVPIVQLTPAERSRLPAFAQPRRAPSSTTGSLELPPGLRAPTASIGQRRPPTPAAQLPSPTTPRQFPPSPPINEVLENLKARVARATPNTPPPRPPASINIPSRTPPSAYIQTAPSVSVGSIEDLNSENSASPGSAADLGQPDADSGLPEVEPLSNRELLARMQGLPNQPTTPPEATPPSNNEGESAPEIIAPPDTNTQGSEGIDIPVENSNPEVVSLALNPANGDAAELQDELTYDSRLTSESAVDEKIAAWSGALAEQKGALPQAQTEVEINAAFKACRTNPPIDGLIGAVIQPGGEIETLEVLRNTGYETINLRAREAVENYDFSSVSEPTEYRIEVKVNYDAENCVDTENLRKRLIEGAADSPE